MATALAIFGVAFSALCIWLTVRVVNCRERWPRWALAAIVAMPALYVLSFGPACWFVSRHGALQPAFGNAYLPLGRVAYRWQPALDGLRWYGSVGMRTDASLPWTIEHIE